MLYTVNYLLFPHSLHGLRDQRLMAILRETHQLPRTQLLELTLQLGKGELDRVPFGTVAHVVHPPETMSSIGIISVIERCESHFVVYYRRSRV